MHVTPHSQESKNKISLAKKGKPLLAKRKKSIVVDNIEQFKCCTCKENFPPEGFYKCKKTANGLKAQCKACHSACSIKSRNKENKRIKARKYEADRLARIAKSPGTVSTNDWNSLLQLIGKRCLKCGSVENITRDHVVPISKGGLHHPTNLQPLCRNCNEKKNASCTDYRTEEQRKEIEKVWALTFRRI